MKINGWVAARWGEGVLRLRHLETGTHKAEYCGRLMEGKTLTLFILSPPRCSAPYPSLHPHPLPHSAPPPLPV